MVTLLAEGVGSRSGQDYLRLPRRLHPLFGEVSLRSREREREFKLGVMASTRGVQRIQGEGGHWE